MRARNLIAVMMLCVVAGCVDYHGAVQRQFEKENAAIAAQTNEVPK